LRGQKESKFQKKNLGNTLFAKVKTRKKWYF